MMDSAAHGELAHLPFALPVHRPGKAARSWEWFVDGEGAGEPPPQERASITRLARQLGHGLYLGGYAAAISGEAVRVKQVTAWAVRSVLREQQIPGGRTLWWTLPEGTVPDTLVPGIAKRLDRPRSRGESACAHTAALLRERRIRIVVLADLHHGLRGRGIKALRYGQLPYLIKTASSTLFVYMGVELERTLLRGPGADMLAPYVHLFPLAAACEVRG
ncbi:hypothetical protein GCM10010156_72980 [Planobispora rosea]|uniref:Uncharacterized protein n=1 Tax=Planobispora rosea TaxID=35762 RepID=A0A8J3S8Z8_PLARO|nr:hypothetical protein [Planobispora rosea]GGT04576.1 hypothetical protein GCM10010156_72980 [Planobispora rosea]GIH88890.1 hypothetical protein Pro02_72980 [Planobispora rosea]